MEGRTPAEDLVKRVLKRSEAAEVYEERRTSMPVSFRAGALESAKVTETTGRALRVISGGRLGYSTTTDLAALDALAENALQSAQYGDPVNFRFPGQTATARVPVFDPEVDALTERHLIAAGQAVSDRVLRGVPDMDAFVTLTKEVTEVRLANDAGLSLCELRTAASLGIHGTRAREGDVTLLSASAQARRWKDIHPELLADRVVERARWADTTVKVASGQIPVVFTPEASTLLFLAIVMGIDGGAVQLGASPLKDRIGQQVFSSLLTLTDDATLPMAPRSGSWDDEGVPTARAPLVERGVLRGYLYNLRKAADAGAKPTGHGWKSGIYGGSFRRPPDVAPTNWIVQPGPKPLQQILAGLGEALLVDAVIGLGQGNVLSGEFSNTVGLGFLVRRGEVMGRVVNTMIAGNIYEALNQKLMAIASEPEWSGPLYTPAIAVDAVSVTSKG